MNNRNMSIGPSETTLVRRIWQQCQAGTYDPNYDDTSGIATITHKNDTIEIKDTREEPEENSIRDVIQSILKLYTGKRF